MKNLIHLYEKIKILNVYFLYVVYEFQEPIKMVSEVTVKDSTPETLVNLCFKYLVKNIETIARIDDVTKDYLLREGAVLPEEICERLVELYQQLGNTIDDKFASIFLNTDTTRLSKIKLRNSTITDTGLSIFLNHELTELDVSNCTSLTEGTLAYLNEKSDNLINLVIGTRVQVLPEVLGRTFKNNYVPSGYEKRGYILRAPNLRKFTLHRLLRPQDNIYFPLLLKPLTKLVHLDLCGCSDIGDASYLCDLTCLVSLILYNVQNLAESGVLQYVMQLVNLKHLDISQSNGNNIYKNANQTLRVLVESLPHLISLDISGTNLAGTGVADHELKPDSASKTDISGLRSRVNNPFKFLGLYGTFHAACRRHDIPAIKISGDANEEQILNAAVAYIDRPDVLTKILNDLYHLFRYDNCVNVNVALGLVLEAMDRNMPEKHIQISGSATLFYIVKNEEKHLFSTKVKEHIVCSLLNGMSYFKTDETMMRNGCLTLCQFKLPHDVLFEYERLVSILLHVVADMDQESFVQRIGIFLLNSLACQVGGIQKQLLGDLGVITRMLSLIVDRLQRIVCDDVLEVAWSTMWNVTDETAVNCQRFLDGKGMELFLLCLSSFPGKGELLRNMMGLLGNVAEVKSLRPRLMTPRFVTVFTELLDSLCDGIEVSYNAAGVLSHMCSDGAEAWTIVQPTRETVLAKMVSAIERWSLSTERNINYRSFEPILGLLKIEHTPECQHWAAWALANLTTVYANKYCTLFESEGGIELLTALVNSESSFERTKTLANIVITNCKEFKEKGVLELNNILDG